MPYVRLLLRFKVQDGSAALLLRFKPKALSHWMTLRDDPALPNGWMGQEWEFEADNSGDAFMTLECAAASKDGAHWPAMYDWLASKLALVHQHALPWLRQALGASADDDDGDDDPKLLTPTRQRQLAFWTLLWSGLWRSLTWCARRSRRHVTGSTFPSAAPGSVSSPR